MSGNFGTHSITLAPHLIFFSALTLFPRSLLWSSLSFGSNDLARKSSLDLTFSAGVRLLISNTLISKTKKLNPKHLQVHPAFPRILSRTKVGGKASLLLDILSPKC